MTDNDITRQEWRREIVGNAADSVCSRLAVFDVSPLRGARKIPNGLGRAFCGEKEWQRIPGMIGEVGAWGTPYACYIFGNAVY